MGTQSVLLSQYSWHAFLLLLLFVGFHLLVISITYFKLTNQKGKKEKEKREALMFWITGRKEDNDSRAASNLVVVLLIKTVL